MKGMTIVTGAAGNLGSKVADKLMREGLDVHGIDYTEKGVGRLRAKGIESSRLDLTDEEAVQRFVDQHGRETDAAVLIAGGFQFGGFSKADEKSIDQMISLNFKTAYHIARQLLPVFEKRGGGRFVFIGARPALDAAAGKDTVAYALSKRLIFTLAEQINAFGKNKDIAASVIVPSIIDTPANREAMPDSNFDNWVRVDDIADAIYFLLTESGKAVREGILKLYNKA